MIAQFMIEWLKIDGIYQIPRGLHIGIGVHTFLHYMGAIRHHRWLYATPEGQLGWMWLRRTGPTGAIIGNLAEIQDVRPKGLALNRYVSFRIGSRTVDTYAPRIEADRLVSFLNRP
jgi:hypothetical protein